MCLIRKSSSFSVSFSLASKIWLSKYVFIECKDDNIIIPYLENLCSIPTNLGESICCCRFIHQNSINMHLNFTKVFLWDVDCIVLQWNQNLFQNELHKRWKMYNISNALFKRISMEDAHTLHFEHYCLHWLLLSIHLNLSLFYAKLPPAYDLIRYLLFLAVMIQLCINLEA